MSKVFNKIKNNLFLSTVIFILIFLFISFILYKCDILFRQWVYYLIGLIIYIGSIGGLIQLIRKIKYKILKAIITFIFILLVILSLLILAILFIFGHQPEHVINKDNNKYVAYVRAFLNVDVTYYDYINFFLRGSKPRISEGYGKGANDPFVEEHKEKEPVSTYYYNYDENGNRIYETSENNNTNNNDFETKKDTISNYTTDDINHFWLGNSLGYRVDIVDCAMGYEAIKIYRTEDSGKNWTSQINSEVGTLAVHYNSTFSFINDNLSFIHDPGRDGVETEYGTLMVSTDSAKTYTECIIEHPKSIKEKNLIVSGLPTYENNELILYIYTINHQNTPIKTYYEYTTKDGITWNYSKKTEPEEFNIVY